MDMNLTLSNRQITPAVVNMFQYENQTTTLNFVLDGYMYDEVDLRNYKAYAVTSQNGLIDYTELGMSYDDVGDVLSLSWTVGEYSLREDGAVLYQIVFKENTSEGIAEGENSSVFYSYKAIIINRGSVDGDDHLTANYPTLLKQWLDKMNSKQLELEKYVAEKVETEFEATNTELVDYINYISSGVNACVIYMPYGQTVEIADRLESRLYYQYLDEAHSMGRFEDHLGNILSNESSGGASLPLFAPMWSDHLLNDISYLRADTFSWQDGEVYKSGYEHLVNDIYGVKYYCFTMINAETGEQGNDIYLDSDTPNPDSAKYAKAEYGMSVLVSGSITEEGQYVLAGADYSLVYYNLVRKPELDVVDIIVEPQTETIGDVEITYYLGADKLKIVLADQESNVQSIYDNNGVAWYYILDTENTRFKLPRTKYDFVGVRDSVGNFVPESLPNITGSYWDEMVNPDETGSEAISVVPGTSANRGFPTGTYTYGEVIFNASNSNATYQDNAPVQQRATEMYLYFYVGNSVRNATEIDMGALAEIVNDFDITTFQEEVNAVTESAIAEISSKSQPIYNIAETSGTISLYANRIYSMSITDTTTFSLPETVDTTYFNQIKVMVNITGTPTIDWGTTNYFGKSAIEVEEGVYDIYFDYDNHLAGWVVGAISKGTE